MQRSVRRAELRAFLRARRAAVKPEQAGIARAGRRLTSGLRREEVAALAGVGLTWYTWLEQGREISVSSDVLRRISRALRLSPSDETYLFTLAGVVNDRRRKTKSAVTPGMRKTIDGFTAGPALIFGPWFDVLAYNESADIIYAFDAVSGRFSNNHVWRLFMDPMRQRIYPPEQLARGARDVVGTLRARYAEHVGRPELEELVEALQAGSELFRVLWDERTTTSLEPFNARFDHPALGALEFCSVRVTPGDAPANMIWLLPAADRRTELTMERALKLRRNKRKRSTR